VTRRKLAGRDEDSSLVLEIPITHERRERNREREGTKREKEISK
jgi:hypothetical protein